MRIQYLEDMDDGTAALALGLLAAIVSLGTTPVLLFVAHSGGVAFALWVFAGVLEFGALIAALWAVYFGIRVLNGAAYGSRNSAVAGTVLAGIVLVPWAVRLLVGQ